MEVSLMKKPKAKKKQCEASAPEVAEEAVDLGPAPAPITLADFVIEASEVEEDGQERVKTTNIGHTEEEENENVAEKPIAFDRTLSINSNATDKENEYRRSSSFVRELPLDALLPRTNSRDSTAEQQPTTSDSPQPNMKDVDAQSATQLASPNATPKSSVAERTRCTIYPTIVGSEVEETRTMPVILPTISIDEAPSISEQIFTHSGKVKYPELHPQVSAPSRSSFGEAELLTEAQLLEFYKNDQLDFVDDFTDVFIKVEIEPRNCLFDLLSKYKEVCECLENVSTSKANSAKVLSALNSEVWEVENRKILQQGKCLCGRSASGDASYKVAALKPEKLVSLSEELNKLNTSELHIGFCQEIRSRALALQIQWVIVDVNNKFFAEHQLSSTSHPILMGVTHSLSSRILLKRAMSDLFYFIRFPALPVRFRDSVTGWISELGSALLRACAPDDQMFLMSHILRCPSPLNSWAVSLIQTFIATPNLDFSVPINSFVASISILLRPVKHREQFLCRLMKYYEGENSWNFVSDDGSMENSNMADLSESDLIAILSQFSIKSLFSASLMYFSYTHRNNRLQILLSLISFVLVFLKICDEGVDSYSSLRNMCKQICGNIRNLVQCFCNYWDLVKVELAEMDRNLIQNEVNRIVLQAAYYIVTKNCIDLWQFLVDFPYGSVTEFCRLRCQLLFRNSLSMTVQNLYEIADDELISKIKENKNLWEQLCNFKRGKEDATYKILALSSAISHCNLEQNFLVFQVIHLCFLDEATREDYYKVGSEAVALFLERHPNLLPFLLKYIDRHVDHLDDYAVDILTNSSKVLRDCQLSAEDVSNVLGKWLINRAVDHPASQIARRVLCSMNWGGFDGNLWLPQPVHDACADTIVKAHIVHCKTQNGMIAKSVSKATKLAMKCPDLEQQFTKFCWDVLIKLKISSRPMTTSSVTNDLTAFYLFIQQRCLHSIDSFVEHGLKYFVELVNASSFKASVIILSQMISKFDSSLDVLIANQSFRNCLEYIIHADESAYALQLIIGADDFPGPILGLIGSSIELQIYAEESIARKKRLAHAWLRILTCKKSIEWNADKFALYLIGIIGKIAFNFDPDALFGIDDVLENLYKAQFMVWKEASKGILSWFSPSMHPPIIASHLLEISPWASFMLLRVEPKFFGAFYDFLDECMCKRPQRTLEEAVKKASSKSHLYMTIERLHYARWLEFSVLNGVIGHEVFPLVLQQLCYVLFARKTFERKKHCSGFRYLKCPATEPLFKKLKGNVLPTLEKQTDDPKMKSFYRAVLQWIFAEEIYSADFAKFGDYILDYLLHTTVTEDKHLWIEFVDSHRIRQSIEMELKTFSTCYHLNGSSGIPESPKSAVKIDTLTKFFGMLESSPSSTFPIPSVPQHKGLPLCEKVEPSWYGLSPLPSVYSRYLDDLNKAAKTFVSGKEAVDSLNREYLVQFQKLYSDSKEVLRVVLRCGNFVSAKCPRPVNVDISVTASNYDQSVAAKMDDNRVKREEEINRLLLMLDLVAIQCAQLEHISFLLCEYSKMMVSGGGGDNDFVRTTGINLFYKICNFVDGTQFLFPAAVQCYEYCLEKLGKAFIAENPNEQLNLMRVVKAGNPLNHFLVPHFTPHCIPPALLFQLYAELSNSVRDASTSEASLALLSRLDIENAGNRMPANQFLALMPMIFENIAYVSSTSPLRHLCMDHFIHAMFHHFPLNFGPGLKLILSGLDSQAVPPELFMRIISRFDGFGSLIGEPYSVKIAQKKMPMTSEQAHDCLRLCSEQLNTSRRLLSTRLFTVWAQYLEPVCKLADYYLRLIVYQTFNSDVATLAIEKELRDVFYLLVSVWGPLLEPVDSGLAPWNVTDNALATVLLDRFTTHLTWLPHSVYLPPGSETVESLFWQYFTSKLLNLQRAGTVHVYSVYEAKVVRLNWARLWPTLLDLSAMETVVSNGPAELLPLIVEIVVRIPWFQLLQHQRSNQPHEAHRAFFSLILSIFARCVYRSANYAKSRASTESLLKLFLEHASWCYVKADAVEKIGEFMANSFPNDLLTTANDVLRTFLCIWRETCFFSTIQRPPNNFALNADEQDAANINRKRATYLRTILSIMLRSTMDREEQKKFYREILTKTNQLLPSDDKLQYVGIVKELTDFWTKIPKEKDVTVVMKTLTEWLDEHCESAILLLIVNTAMQSLPIPMGLKLLDNCVRIYFHRRLSCDWNEISGWLTVPERSKEWLYTTPRSDSDVSPQFFVLNAHLISEMSRLRSASEECKLLRRIADYIQSIKPKYVTNEPAFLLCVEKWQRMAIRQFSNGVTTVIANEEVEMYLKWLRKVYIEEKSSSIFNVVAKFTARKPTFSPRIQLFANVIDLYITQQQRSLNQPPRLAAGQPVLNSRIHAFNELKQQKQYHEFIASQLFVNVLPFFTQIESHNLSHAMQLFSTVARALYPSEKFLQNSG